MAFASIVFVAKLAGKVHGKLNNISQPNALAQKKGSSWLNLNMKAV